MHLGNGAITPECAAITLGAAAVGLGAATSALRRELPSREKLALAVGLGSLVFAAQAVNVPVLPGASAHLVGGVLLAWTLGPGLGAWTMVIILAVQALLLGDGGLAALGANIVNMALVPAGCIAACRQWKLDVGRLSHAAPVAAAVLSVPLAAMLIAGQTALFRSGAELTGWQDFSARLIATHSWIGLLEGGCTLVAVVTLAWLRQSSHRPAAATFAVALAIAALALPWSSSLPDGYEAALEAADLAAWLSGGSGAALDLATRIGEQGAVLAGMLLVGLLTAALGVVAAGRRPLPA